MKVFRECIHIPCACYNCKLAVSFFKIIFCVPSTYVFYSNFSFSEDKILFASTLKTLYEFDCFSKDLQVDFNVTI